MRLPPELRARIMDLASSMGITTSEWLRMVLTNAVESAAGLGALSSEDQGYVAGRELGLKLASDRLKGALDELPASYHEAMTLLGS